ncbi:Hsp70 family protein [soil metagenome]
MTALGVDFGTSNSLAAVWMDGRVELARFADGSSGTPTVLYFPLNGKQYYIGGDGIERYFEDLENGHGGRLMFSIKSLLSDEKFDHTLVPKHGHLTASNLASYFIRKLKQSAEAHFEREFDEVVLGRPVEFKELAIGRLREAAEDAGFKKITFCLEPVAAAVSYEATATGNELVCVIDLGGGTSDICVVQTTPGRLSDLQNASNVKAVAGVNIAGDEISAQVFRQKLSPRFGAGSTFHSLGKEFLFPVHIINKLDRWHRINLLKNQRDLTSIAEIIVSSDRPEDVKRLQTLIREHLGFQLFKSVEAAKAELSTDNETSIYFKRLGLDEAISRREFEGISVAIFEQIRVAILDTLNAASVRPDQIDRVLLTGGTSQIPFIQQIVGEIFAKDKIRQPGFFSSVASGLGRLAGQM